MLKCSIGKRNRQQEEQQLGKCQAVAFWAVELDRGGGGGGDAACLACASARSNWGQSYKKCSAVGSRHCSGWQAVTLLAVPLRGWHAAEEARGRSGRGQGQSEQVGGWLGGPCSFKTSTGGAAAHAAAGSGGASPETLLAP